MNFYDFCIGELVNRGMFENQAKEVMQRVMTKENDTMAGRWQDKVSDYPPALKGVIWMGVEHETLEYIKENCPEAWFRPVFDKDHPMRKEFESLKERGEV